MPSGSPLYPALILLADASITTILSRNLAATLPLIVVEVAVSPQGWAFSARSSMAESASWMLILCAVGTRHHARHNSGRGEGILEESIEVRGYDHLHETIGDQLGDRPVGSGRHLEAIVPILPCRLKVRRQQVPAVSPGRGQFLEHFGVNGFAARMFPIPGKRTVADIPRRAIRLSVCVDQPSHPGRWARLR